MKRIILMLTGSSVLLFCLIGCGGGGGDSSRQQKTADIAFGVISGAHSAPLNTVQLSVKLPEGLVFKNLTSLTGHNDTGQLVDKTYNASTRTLSFAVMSVEPIRFFNAVNGTNSLATLTCAVTPGYTLSQSGFTALNSPLPLLEMFSANYHGNTVTLTDEMRDLVKMVASFGY